MWISQDEVVRGHSAISSAGTDRLHLPHAGENPYEHIVFYGSY